MHVQFTDSSQTTIISAFSCGQDHEFFPNQGEVEEDDPRYISFIAPFRIANPSMSSSEE